MTVLANGGREARGGAAIQLNTNENGVLRHDRDGYRSHESTAGLTAPVRLFILSVATTPVAGAQDDTNWRCPINHPVGGTKP